MRTKLNFLALVFLISQNCFANGFDEIKEFANYLSTGSSTVAPALNKNNELATVKNHFLHLELELGASSPSEYAAKSTLSAGSAFYSRSMKSSVPEIRATVGLNFTPNLGAQFTYAHFEQSQDYSQATNFVFNSQTFLAGQTFTLKNSVNFFRALAVYSFNPIGPFHLGLGLGLMNVSHKTSVSVSGTSASANKDLIVPLLNAQSTLNLLGPVFMHGELTSSPYNQQKIQTDAAVGLGIDWNSIGFKVGSRWFESAMNQNELNSKLNTQVFFGSIFYKL